MKKLTDLFSLGDKVFVKLDSLDDERKFLAMADEEGFTIGSGAKAVRPLDARAASVMVVHSDKTITFPGFAGITAFDSGSSGICGEPMIQVDFSEFLTEK